MLTDTVGRRTDTGRLRTDVNYFGEYRAIVVDNNDPEGMSRLRVRIPSITGPSTTTWAWPKSILDNTASLPEVGSGVFVTFEGGDLSAPLWTGVFGSPSRQSDIHLRGKLLMEREDSAGSSSIVSTPLTGISVITAVSQDNGAALHLRSPSGQSKAIHLMNPAAQNRWVIQSTNTAETGANAGSNFSIHRYADNGTLLGTPLSITRATGQVVVAADPTSSLGVATKQYVDGQITATEQYVDGQITATEQYADTKVGKTGDHTMTGTLAIAKADSGGGATLQVTPTVGTAGILVQGPTGSGAALWLRGPAGQNRGVYLQTGSLNRWHLYTDGTAESGSNNGSNLNIDRYDDSGESLGTALSINRATGAVNIPSGTLDAYSAIRVNKGDTNGNAALYLQAGSTGTYNDGSLVFSREGQGWQAQITTLGTGTAADDLLIRTWRNNTSEFTNSMRFDRETGNIYTGAALQSLSWPVTSMRTATVAEHGSWTSPVTGAYLIELPAVAFSAMMTIRVRGYEYSSTGGGWEYLLGGYTYTPASPTAASWYNTSAILNCAPGLVSKLSEVKFLAKNAGTTDARFAIAIGTTAATWTYPQLHVEVSMQSGGASTDADILLQKWTVSHTTDLSGWTSQSAPSTGLLRPVRASGDTMSGSLTLTGNVTASPSTGEGIVQAVSTETGAGSRIISSSASGSALLEARSPAGDTACLYFRGGTDGLKVRWNLYKAATAEAGSNTGGDLYLVSYDDAGAALQTALVAYRATGLITVKGDPTAPLGIATKQYVDNVGVWTTYTPSFNAAVTIGNGSVSGRYTRIGDTVHFEAKLVLGTTSSLSGSQVRLTLPPVAKLSGTLGSYTAKLANSVAYWTLATFAMSSTEVSVDVIDTKGVATAMSSTNPTTLPGTGATIYLTGTYEAA